MADRKVRQSEFVLLRKERLDEYLKTTVELNSCILWLRDQREKLLQENERLRAEADEMNVTAQKLMTLYRELEKRAEELDEENERLLRATRAFGRAGDGLN